MAALKGDNLILYFLNITKNLRFYQLEILKNYLGLFEKGKDEGNVVLK